MRIPGYKNGTENLELREKKQVRPAVVPPEAKFCPAAGPLSFGTAAISHQLQVVLFSG